MSKSGLSFEKDVKLVYDIVTALDPRTSVTHNELIEGPDGVRQFDIVLRTEFAGEECLTVVECKDHSRTVTVTAVDGLHSKMADVGANKGILIARKAFSKSAKQKASRLGITLATVDNLSKDMENPLGRLPVIFRHVGLDQIRISLRSEDIAGKLDSIQVNPNSVANGIGVMGLIKLAGFSKLLQDKTLRIEVTEDLLGQPVWVTSMGSEKGLVKKLTLAVELSDDVHFGYANMLPSALVKSNIDNTMSEIFIDSHDFVEISERFTKFRTFEDIPKHLKHNHLAVLSVPGAVEKVGKITMSGQRKEDLKWERLATWPSSQET